MNNFETYLKKILIIVKENHKDLGLKNLNDSKSINLEIPPSNFEHDLSSNISMVLAKKNSLNPKELSRLHIQEL